MLVVAIHRVHSRFRLLLPVAVAGCLAIAQAQTSFDWLNDAVTPRDIALANAADVAGRPESRPSVKEEISRGVGERDRELLLAFTRYPADILHAMIRLQVPLGRHGADFELRHLGYGTFTAYDEDGQQGENYTAADVLFRVHLDYKAGELLWFNFSGGYLSSQLADATAQALTWSAGAQLAVFPLDARIGMTLQNRGWFMDSYGRSENDQLPTTWLVGISKSLAYLPLTLYVSVGENQRTSRFLWRLGGEFRIADSWALRLGVDQGKLDYTRGSAYADLLAGFSIGCGFRTGAVSGSGIGEQRRTSMLVDIATKMMGPLGLSSSVAVGLAF